METAQIEQKIKTVLGKVISVDPAKINKDTSSATVKKWDSLKQMQLVLALEEEFSIQFGDEEISKMLSYSEILRSILSKVK